MTSKCHTPCSKTSKCHTPCCKTSNRDCSQTSKCHTPCSKNSKRHKPSKYLSKRVGGSASGTAGPGLGLKGWALDPGVGLGPGRGRDWGPCGPARARASARPFRPRPGHDTLWPCVGHVRTCFCCCCCFIRPAVVDKSCATVQAIRNCHTTTCL